MAKDFRALIARVQSRPTTHDNVLVKVTITNISDRDLKVLTWNTPLDRIVSDCLEVTVDGKAVPYDGPVVKRGTPEASDYLVIKAGQSAETEYAVSDAYDTSKAGTYRVKLKTPILDVAPNVPGVAKAVALGKREPQSQPLDARTTFKVEKGLGNHQTLGEVARSEEKRAKASAMSEARPKKKAKKKSTKGSSLRAALTKGGTAAQKSAALQAHSDGYDLCVAALAGMANDARYAEWFGAHTTARFNKVKSNLSTVKQRMETTEFTYDLTGAGCTAGVYAYTYKGTTTIWFCDKFWSAPTTGTDSKAGTVLHEHTHSDAATDDIQYGQAACRALARNDPDSAISNADSHEYYAGG